ncbi:hypothetical protein FB446DRAFT_831924 [Lentinula raphanica]|nr:hypothetical protein FB446DRAFT_831924 [Lentinula raphanica]
MKHTLTISQCQYVLDLLERVGMSDCNSVMTPLDLNMRLSADQSPQTPEEYEKIVPRDTPQFLGCPEIFVSFERSKNILEILKDPESIRKHQKAPTEFLEASKNLDTLGSLRLPRNWGVSLGTLEMRIFFLMQMQITEGTQIMDAQQPDTSLKLAAEQLAGPANSKISDTLVMTDSFDAYIWAMATAAFWGMMHFGEVAVKSRSCFDVDKHLRRVDAVVGHDLDRVEYIKLELQHAKTAKPGEIQSIFLTGDSDLSPI